MPDYGTRVALSHHAGVDDAQAMVVLRKQYRMAYDIMALANELVYGGQLACSSSVVAEAALQLPRRCDDGLPPWLVEVLAGPFAAMQCPTPSVNCTSAA